MPIFDIASVRAFSDMLSSSHYRGRLSLAAYLIPCQVETFALSRKSSDQSAPPGLGIG